MKAVPRPVLDWPVWTLVAVSLVLGSLLQQAEAGRTATARVGSTHLAYPVGWAPQGAPAADDFAAADLAAGAYGNRVELRRLKAADLIAVDGAAPQDAMGALSSWSLTRGQAMTGYRVLGQTSTTALGRPAARLDYAYLADPPGGPLPGALPVLIRASDTLVPSGDGVYVLTVAGRADGEASRLDALRARLLAAWEQP